MQKYRNKRSYPRGALFWHLDCFSWGRAISPDLSFRLAYSIAAAMALHQITPEVPDGTYLRAHRHSKANDVTLRHLVETALAQAIEEEIAVQGLPPASQDETAQICVKIDREIFKQAKVYCVQSKAS